MNNEQTDDQILEDVDAVIAEIATPAKSTFPDIIDRWTEALLEENAKADLVSIALILRLGTLGQRLMYEAHTAGLEDVLRISKEINNG